MPVYRQLAAIRFTNIAGYTSLMGNKVNKVFELLTLKRVFLPAFLLFSLNIYSQIREFSFEHFTPENGLPESSVSSLIQDSQGYIWFGTQNGLVRYDGYNMKVYRLATDDQKELVTCVITAIFIDKNGNMWVGTAFEGLYRYNRLADNFTRFSHKAQEQEKIGRDNIQSIVQDNEGMIWYSSLNGSERGFHLDRLDPKTNTLISFDSLTGGRNNIPSARFNNLISDGKGKIWLGTENGLFGYNQNQHSFTGYFVSKDPAANHQIKNIYEAPSAPGVLWLSLLSKKEKGLVEFNVSKAASKTYSQSNSIPNSLINDTVLTVFEDPLKRLWIGTANGLCLFDRKLKTFRSYLVKNAEPHANYCLNINGGREGGLWILTGFNVLYLTSPQATLMSYKENTSETDGIANGYVVTSLIDNTGTLWIGGIGLFRLNELRSKISFIQKKSQTDGYPGGLTNSLIRLKNGHYITVGEKGVFECDPFFQKFKEIKISHKNVNDFFPTNGTIDNQGNIWISTYGDGLFKYQPALKKVSQYLNDPNDSLSIPSNNIFRLFVDSHGTLWLGSIGGGLARLNANTGKFDRFPYIDNVGNAPKNNELADNDVGSIYEDKQGILWVGTMEGGLNRMNPYTGKFQSFYNLKEGFIFISAMYEDRQNRMWVGTYLGGLFLFDRNTGKYKRITEKEGLLYNNVTSINEDDSGNLWVASARGFSIINPKDFSIKTLTKLNGLPTGNIEFTPRYIAENGDWLKTTFHGILRFNPNDLKVNPVPPKVVIQQLTYTKSTRNQSVDKMIVLTNQKQVELAYNENRITFEYAGMHYTNPQFNQYQYKLEGYDKNWLNAKYQRIATYTNLSPGAYTFMVKASNSDGVWSKVPASISLVIHPPWWKTWWAYTLYGLLFLLAIGSYITYRSRTLRRTNKLLEEKVSYRTAQLQKSISDLKSTQTQLIQSEKMASLGELIAGIAHEIQNPLNFINNFAEVSTELTEEMKNELDEGKIQEVKDLASNVGQNLEKIVYHGKRADSIVKNMLQHSRKNSGQKELTDINALADEYLRLSYHGLRAKDKSFNATLKTNFDPSIGNIQVLPQDIGRVFLNLFNNAFYSVMEKKKSSIGTFEPTIYITTELVNNNVKIKIRDNGMGIPKKVFDKIYQPFFTTKPTGEGTGLGLSMSYDIITKGHGGSMKAETEEGEFAEFEISLPA